MGFRKPDLDQARWAIQKCIMEITSPYNDGWTSSGCKQDLYMLKSWLDEQYARLPYFTGEDKWEQQRIMDRLRQPER
jgi:hypothetical protein